MESNFKVMKGIIAIFLMFLPSFLQVQIRRSLLNQRIGKMSKISFLSFVKANQISIGDNVVIKPFAIIRAEILEIDDHSIIKSLSYISTRVVKIKKYVHIANFAIINGPFLKLSEIEIGNHSRIFPFCWLDTNRKITIGNHVGIGGFTLIFTHGVWSNYFKGGPIALKEVIIEDNVWLPWRVFIMPGVTIKSNSIIGANSLINSSIPENSLAAGSPAKVLKQNFMKKPSNEELLKRIQTSIDDFLEFLIFKKRIKSFEKKSSLIYKSKTFNIFIDKEMKNEEVLSLYIYSKNEEKKRKHNCIIWNVDSNTFYGDKKIFFANEFSDYIRRYGVRLNRIGDNGDLY